MNDERACGLPLGMGGQELLEEKVIGNEQRRTGEVRCWMGLLSTHPLKVSRIIMAGLEMTEKL